MPGGKSMSRRATGAGTAKMAGVKAGSSTITQGAGGGTAFDKLSRRDQGLAHELTSGSFLRSPRSIREATKAIAGRPGSYTTEPKGDIKRRRRSE